MSKTSTRDPAFAPHRVIMMAASMTLSGRDARRALRHPLAEGSLLTGKRGEK